MNHLAQFFQRSRSIKDFGKEYFAYLGDLLNQLDPNSLASFVGEVEKARTQQRTIFIVGNGGSAATASHMANDLGGDVLKKSGCDLPFRALALTDNAALTMAIANDDGYENIFVHQLRIHYRQGDVLIAISASGNSPNVVTAAEWVKKRSGKVLSLVGFDGGRLKAISDVAIHVVTPKEEYGPVEDIHLIMDHVIANWLQYSLNGESNKK